MVSQGRKNTAKSKLEINSEWSHHETLIILQVLVHDLLSITVRENGQRLYGCEEDALKRSSSVAEI